MKCILTMYMKGTGDYMKLYILNTGYLLADRNTVVGCAVIGTKSQPKIMNQMIKLPVMAFLIETEDGYILYDTGSNPEAMNGYWPNHLQETYPLYQSQNERLEKQLAKCGVAPDDIKTVIISHFHMDHAGNLNLFPHADIYAPKADFLNGMASVHSCTDTSKHGAYIKADMDFPVKQYHLVEEDMELASGIELINLPGHAPGLLGLVLHLESGTYILPQDCLYTSEIYGPPAKPSGLFYDSLAFFKSIEKVRKLEKKYNAKVIFAHDNDFFQTLKLAPDYYE